MRKYQLQPPTWLTKQKDEIVEPGTTLKDICEWAISKDVDLDDVFDQWNYNKESLILMFDDIMNKIRQERIDLANSLK